MAKPVISRTITFAKNAVAKGRVSSYTVDKDGLYIVLRGQANTGKVFHVAEDKVHFRPGMAVVIAAMAKNDFVSIEHSNIMNPKQTLTAARCVGYGRDAYIP